jgi:hypothetical protein
MPTSTLCLERTALVEPLWRGIPLKLGPRHVIPKRPDRRSAPLSFAQRQIWIIDQMAPGNPAYNMPYGYRLHGQLDLEALEHSFNEIVRRHETLRTTIAVEDGEPAQIVHPELTITLEITPLDHLPADEREKTLHAFASEISIQSFDLSRLPLLRVFLFKLSEDEHILIINLHHIIADGLSITLLLK